MVGLFIGTSISSLVLFVFRIIPVSSLGMIAILYLYAVVGGITGFIVHKRIEDNPKVVVPQKVKYPKTEHAVIQKNGNPKAREKLENPVTKEEINNPAPRQKTIKIENYKQKLDEIKNLKRASLILKGLVETRKKIEGMKKESNSILEDVVEKMDGKSLDLTKNYLETS